MQWMSDLRIAARTAWRRKASSAAVVAALGMGTGLAAAVVIVAWSVLGRPLPYPEPERLVVLQEEVENGDRLPASYQNFADWRDRSGTLVAAAAVAGPTNRTVTGAALDGPERVPVLFVSTDYFAVAGVTPELGRPLNADDQVPGGAAAAVVSHDFWVRALGAPTDLTGVAIGTQDLMNRSESYAVVGVMPPGFRLEGGADVYLPLDRAVPWTTRGNHVVDVVARMGPDASVASARTELSAIQSAIHAGTEETEATGVAVTSLHQERVGAAASPLLLLVAGAGCLLLIAFVNAGGAILARGVTRSRELAVRSALGAPRIRVAWELVSESVVLGAAGAVLGATIGYGLIAAFSRADPSVMPRLGEISARWLPVLATGAGLSVLGVALFGVGTAAFLTRRYATGRLRSASAGATRREKLGWRGLLGLEVAVALALLVGAGLLGRTVQGILNEDVGYTSEGVVTAQINLPSSYATVEDFEAYYAETMRGLRAIPGVEAAGLTSTLPIPDASRIASPLNLDDGATTTFAAQYRVADPGLFDALGIETVDGRVFRPSDDAGAPHVAVVSTSLADRLWPDQDPIGQRFNLGGMDPYADEWLTVVGVVEEARPWDVAPGAFPTYYVAHAQRPAFLAFFGMELVVRGDRPDLAGAVATAVEAAAPDVPARIATLDDRLGAATAQRRFVLAGMSVFGGLALLLVGIGIWGVVSFLVARRRRELGIRSALGASPGSVIRAVQLEALLPALAGVVVGSALAAMGTGLIRSLLFGIQPLDPATFVAAALAVGTSAWLASWLPARRATRVDPATVLREE